MKNSDIRNHNISHDDGGGAKNNIYNSAKYSSSSISKMPLKKPQKKFADKKKSSASIREPREVRGRRDIEVLFEDMTIADLTQVVEKGNLNAVIQLQKKKIDATNRSRSSKIKRHKVTENEDFPGATDRHQDDPYLEQKAIAQALAFQKDLQE